MQNYAWYINLAATLQEFFLSTPLESVLLMSLIPSLYIVLVQKSDCFITAVNIIFMSIVESSLLSSSVKWIQTAALGVWAGVGGCFLCCSRWWKGIYNSLQSLVSHTQHLYLPTFIGFTSSYSNSIFCLLSYPPFCFILTLWDLCFVWSTFFISTLWNPNTEDMSVKAYEDTKKQKGCICVFNQNSHGKHRCECKNLKQMWVTISQIKICFYWWFFSACFFICSHQLNMQNQAKKHVCMV